MVLEPEKVSSFDLCMVSTLYLGYQKGQANASNQIT